MKKLLDNVATLHSPWNCPHGRPTLITTPQLENIITKININKQYEL